MMVIAFVTSINVLGVDWLMRFETFLGVMPPPYFLVFRSSVCEQLTKPSFGLQGCEPAMDGPHFYMLILGLAMPLLYSLPTALISAELATNYPETGGQCVYVSLACGPLRGAHNTWWYVISTLDHACSSS